MKFSQFRSDKIDTTTKRVMSENKINSKEVEQLIQRIRQKALGEKEAMSPPTRKLDSPMVYGSSEEESARASVSGASVASTASPIRLMSKSSYRSRTPSKVTAMIMGQTQKSVGFKIG